jgi:hypothetical protein
MAEADHNEGATTRNAVASADLVPMALAQVRKAKDGDVRAARYVLAEAAVALRDLLGETGELDRGPRQMPDVERMEYLRYLLWALEKIQDGAAPQRALGIWTDNRPPTLSSGRDYALFFDVCREHSRTRDVNSAIASVTRHRKVGKWTVRKAWQFWGARRAWKAGSGEFW